MPGCAGARCKVQPRAWGWTQLNHCVERCGKLQQVCGGVGLGESDQAAEHILPYEASSLIIKQVLQAIELLARAAAGFFPGVRRARQ